MSLEADTLRGLPVHSSVVATSSDASVGSHCEPIDTAIADGEVHVWRVNLDEPAPAGWQQALAQEDFRRADRFVRSTDRSRFLLARYSLRRLLAAYSGRAPCDLEFRFNEYGKPELVEADGLNFNLSHSDHLAAIAIGRQRVGIDIERICPRGDLRPLAQQVFCADEYRAFSLLPDHAMLLPFLTCWTRKEAYLKALGVGLSVDARSIDVGLSAERRQIGHSHTRNVIVETIAMDSHAVLSLGVCGAPGDRPQEHYRGACIRRYDPQHNTEIPT